MNNQGVMSNTRLTNKTPHDATLSGAVKGSRMKMENSIPRSVKNKSSLLGFLMVCSKAGLRSQTMVVCDHMQPYPLKLK